MKWCKFLNNDYFKVFIKREGKVVLGKNYANLWLLTIVLAATFVAIAFSSGSMLYLEDKMKDPFINWVDIDYNSNSAGDFDGLMYDLGAPDVQEEYHFSDYQADKQFNYFFFGKTDDLTQYLSVRFFGDFQSGIIESILDKDGKNSKKNVVDDVVISDLSLLGSYSLGIIMTKEALKKLGYDRCPAYVDLYAYCPGADTVGIRTIDDRARVPIPIIGLVNHLPGNKDFIASRAFYEQKTNDIMYPLNLNKPEYGHSLMYFVPADVEMCEFEEVVKSAFAKVAPNVGYSFDPYSFYPSDQLSYKNTMIIGGKECPSSYVKIISTDGTEFSYDTTMAVNDEIMSALSAKDVHRLFDYTFSDHYVSGQDYISVHFNDLDKIQDFEKMVNKREIKIEMAQINAKENFNEVRLMANILSWSMIAFAIVCIILFIVNLLQSYFQKVKKNLGTFKAFGISNRELIGIYMLIMITLVFVAIVLSLSFVYLVQIVMPVLGILKEGQYNFLCLWNGKTLCSVAIILVASFVTVLKVMGVMLRQTPGDLIYDRQ